MILYNGYKVYMDGEYPAVFKNGKNYHLHKLVWEDYYGEIPNGYVIHHKDENKLNWDIENLELLSRKDHLAKHRKSHRPKNVPVIAFKDGLTIYCDSIKDAAKTCGTYTSSIGRIFNGKQKTANGFEFRRG